MEIISPATCAIHADSSDSFVCISLFEGCTGVCEKLANDSKCTCQLNIGGYRQ